MKPQVPRSRPTNNQLLYKAHFRWEHYTHRHLDTSGVQCETDPCASVTAAFLKVLSILQRVELAQAPRRNILQILASNTRRTKVLELSTGTHRIPDELKKHFLTDAHGAQYSTNLDRNRYGSDNNYLFTVIKHDLEMLGLCPNLVDVEIIDAKAHGESQLVNSGIDACTCSPRAGPLPGAPLPHAPGAVATSGGGSGMPAAGAQGECSQLFEALVAAAADATAEQAEADTAAQDGRPVVRSRSADHRLLGMPSGGPHGHMRTASPARNSPPGRRRPPGRVATGIFSVNSSDLLGFGLSALDNSGLVVGGEPEADRRNEVEQGPRSGALGGKRARPDADTISEQGDTDRYLKNMAADNEGDLRARGHVPRQNSIVVTHNGTPAKDLRGLWLEVQVLQQQQQHLEGGAEDQKRAALEFETQLGQVQRGIQALQQDRAQLKSSVTALTMRVGALEGALQASAKQMTSLQQLVLGMVAPGRAAGAASDEATPSSGAMPPPSNHAPQSSAQPHSRAPAEVPVMQVAAALQMISQNAAAAAAAAGAAPEPAPLREARSSDDGAPADAGAPPQASEAAGTQAPPTLPGISVPRGTPRSNQLDQLGPIATLQQNSSARLNGGGSLPQVQDALEGEPQQMAAVKFDDSDKIKMLPRFDDFGSLSDLGSLFSAGAGRSVDLRSGGRAPPRANLSISSPHPTLQRALPPASQDTGKEQAHVTNGVTVRPA